jgi:hypothetical protein
VVIRWGSFISAAIFNGSQPPTDTVAVSASVPDLAATGLAGILVPAVAFLVGGGAIEWLTEETFVSSRPRLGAIAFWLLLIAVPIAFSFGPQIPPLPKTLDWIVASVGFDSGVIAYVWIGEKKFSILGGIAFGVGLSLYFSLVASISGNPASIGPRVYQFQAQAGTQLPAGRYVSLGHADGVAYLQSCGDLSFHAVPDIQIVDARFAERSSTLAQPSVLKMFLQRKGPVLGYRPDC